MRTRLSKKPQVRVRALAASHAINRYRNIRQFANEQEFPGGEQRKAIVQSAKKARASELKQRIKEDFAKPKNHPAFP